MLADKSHYVLKNKLIAIFTTILTMVSLPVFARDFRIIASVDGFAKDNGPNGIYSELDTTGESIYTSLLNTYNERGILEFDISSLPSTLEINSANLELRIDLVGGSGSLYPDLDIHGYTGNGVIELADATVPFNRIGYLVDPYPFGYSITLDKNYVQSLFGTTDYLGISLRVQDYGYFRITSKESAVPYATPPALVLKVGDTIYVDDNAPAGGNGLAWESAYNSLQDALDVAEPGMEIWVATGTYTPTAQTSSGDPRSATFALKNGVGIYGGFYGNESALNQRIPLEYETILSGDLAGNDSGNFTNNDENVYHVLIGSDNDATAILDGFTIKGGCATGSTSSTDDGAGIYLDNSSPIIRNCRFISNEADDYGGAIYNYSGNGTSIINCEFLINDAYSGGGIYNYYSDPVVVNCTLAGNSGGVYNWNSAPLYINCILWGNSGSGLYDQVERFDDAVFRYCCIQDWRTPGVDGNINSDPMLVNAPLSTTALERDLRLYPTSPCVDAGSNDELPPDISDLDQDGNLTEPTPLDLAFKQRFADNICVDDTGLPANGISQIIDMGAREIVPPLPAPGTRIYVDQSATQDNNGMNWENAFIELSVALDSAYHYTCTVEEIWVAEGEYRPTNGYDRHATFNMINSVGIYGGFSGTETNLEERDTNPATNGTILTGNVGETNDETDNSYSVVTAKKVNSTAILDGFTVCDGYADGDFFHRERSSGGGVVVSNATPIISNCRVMNNKAETGAGLFSYENSRPTLSNCDFIGNEAKLGSHGGRYGGGVYAGHTAAVDAFGCKFISNICTNGGGGGVFCDQATCEALLVDCEFRNNEGFRGGAVLSFMGNTTAINCVFKGNESYNYQGTNTPFGGAFYSYKGTQRFVNCLFQDNATTSLGGGLCLIESLPGTYLSGCTITGNSAGDRGGGITVAQKSNIEFSNSIIWNNTDTNGVDTAQQNLFDYADYGSNVITVNHTCIQDDQPDDGSVYPGNGNIDLAPLFIDAAGGDLRLAGDSPCLNAGSNGLLPLDAFDLDGDGITDELIPFDLNRHLRLVGGIVDIGAYENQTTAGDCDGNGIVDTMDLHHLTTCLSGPGSESLGNCTCCDMDNDNDVDLIDFSMFQQSLTPKSTGNGDCDSDGDIDIDDLEILVNCLAGPGIDADTECLCVDLDGDGDVDLLDYNYLMRIATDPNAGSPDLDRDGDVDLADFMLFQSSFGRLSGSSADLNDDGYVNLDDFELFMSTGEGITGPLN